MPLCLVLNFFPPQDPKSKSKCLLGGSSPLVLYVASCNCVCRSSMLSRSVARVIISSLLAISLLKACEDPLSRQQMGSTQQQDVRLGQHGGCYRHRASRANDHFRTQCLLLDHHLCQGRLAEGRQVQEFSIKYLGGGWFSLSAVSPSHPYILDPETPRCA